MNEEQLNWDEQLQRSRKISLRWESLAVERGMFIDRLLLDKERLHRDLTFCRFALICIAVLLVISWNILFTLIDIAFDGASLNH